MTEFFKTKTSLYTFYGTIFGFLFPIGATILDSALKPGGISFTTIIAVQMENPLLWIIDSAPFWLGIFARMGGIKQDQLIEIANTLERKVEEKTADLKETNENLLKAKIAAESASQIKSEFLANMSHEIRTPLNGILGFTDMLIETKLKHDQLDYVQTIKRSGDTLISLINDILDFSKIEAGQLDFEHIVFDPELIIYDISNLIRPRIGDKPVEILCFVDDKVPAYLKGDPTRFRQVLTNIAGNAPKFTEKGEIEISLEVEEENESKIKLHARIRDTGIGIPENKIKSIFEPFKQADGSVTRKYGGTGLGLAISKKLAKLMKGDIWVKSEENEGSVFHFTAWLEKVEEKHEKRILPVSLENKTALIIDDNPANLKILSHNLSAIKMNTIASTKPKEAIPLLKENIEAGNKVDICVLDIQMPELSGYDLARQISNLGKSFSTIPLLALSSSMGNEAKKCEEAGFYGFLSKPVHKEKLYQMIERMLSKRKDSDKGQKISTQYSIREEVKHGLRILLAEDNPTNQKLAKLMLSKAGYNVKLANNGQEAADMFSADPEKFDLIFMDIQMPEVDGIQATKMIRAKGFTDIPIIALTAHAMKGDKDNCLKEGMNDYISKPISRKAVFDILDKWILNRETV